MKTPDAPIEQEYAYKVMRQRCGAALTRTETWIDHPTFDTKSAVLDNLRGTRAAAEVLYEVTTGRLILDSWAFDVPWLAWSDLISAVMYGNKVQQRKALWKIRRAQRDGIMPE
jgi:hypothetical protein